MTELIMVKADWSRTFIGEIRRFFSEDNSVVHGEVRVDEGIIYSMAEDEDQLCRNLDELCALKLDHGLHHSTGVFMGEGDYRFLLN